MGLLHRSLAVHTNRMEDFNRLVADMQDSVYTLAYVILGRPVASEKAVQTAFLQVYQGLASRKMGSPRLQVYRLLLEACRRELSSKGSVLPEAGLIPDGSERAAWRRLMALPLDLRLAAALVDVVGLDYEQASELLGIRVLEMRKRLALARGFLARQVSR